MCCEAGGDRKDKPEVSTEASAVCIQARVQSPEEWEKLPLCGLLPQGELFRLDFPEANPH